jgi:MbtH protein
MSKDDEDNRTYEVVMNHEEQYSIWITGRNVPPGWSTVGKAGSKAECLEYIEQVWRDMRPLSLRKHMEAFERPVVTPPSAEDVQARGAA